jgi:hypothetical protein
MMSQKASVPYAGHDPRELSLEPAAVTDWQALRHEINAKDRLLRERTFKWLATLPGNLRPMATARQYPRIVNRLGDLWSHCEYTRLYFQSLLLDRRPGREGFPSVVRHELEVLQDYYFENLSGLPAILWDAVPLTPPKIPRTVLAANVQKTEIDILPLETAES